MAGKKPMGRREFLRGAAGVAAAWGAASRAFGAPGEPGSVSSDLSAAAERSSWLDHDSSSPSSRH